MTHRLNRLGLTTPTTVLFLLFCALSVWNMSHHELWRDEMQAWLISLHSHNLFELWVNLRLESHLPLWYLLLTPIGWVTRDPIGMQILHLLIAAGSVYLFLRYSPFSTLEKSLFTFGYYPFYEYAVISRHYSLVGLLLFAICAVYGRLTKPSWYFFALCALLCLTSVFGIVLAVGCTLMLVTREYKRYPSKAMLLYGASIACLTLLCLRFVTPPEYSGLVRGWYGMQNIWHVLHKVGLGYFPDVLASTPTKIIIACYVLIFFSTLFWKRKSVFCFFILSNLGIMGLYFIGSVIQTRYSGANYYLLIAAIWLYRQDNRPIDKSSHSYRFVGYGCQALLILVLILHLTMSSRAICQDYQRPFSAAKQTAEFLKENGLDKATIIADKDFAMSTLSGYLDRPIHLARGDRDGTFTKWDFIQAHAVSQTQIIQQARRLQAKSSQDVLVILTYPTCAPNELGSIASFTNGIDYEEKYYIYRLR